MPTVGEYIARVVIRGCWCCWKLPLAPNGQGYVQLRLKGKQPLAHRAIYKHLIGPIPRGLTLDHLCRNRWCCNPSHVEPVTSRVNVLRGDTVASRNAAKTRCPAGHIYDVVTSRSRRCRTCLAQAGERWRRSHGVKPQRVAPLEKILNLKRRGWTQRKIMKHLRVSSKTVVAAVKEDGFSRVE